MNKIDTLKKIIQLGIATLTCALLFTAVAGADSVSVVKMTDDTVIEVEINAIVMEVKVPQSNIVIAEKRFEVKPFTMDGKSGKTRLFDASGNPVKLSFFKEGQRVYVEGYEFSEGDRYVAKSIRLISQTDVRNDYRKIEKMGKVKP